MARLNAARNGERKGERPLDSRIVHASKRLEFGELSIER